MVFLNSAAKLQDFALENRFPWIHAEKEGAHGISNLICFSV
jgi:hypothetical protein